MKTIKILKETCSGYPMIWDVLLPDGSEGYIKFRGGIIELQKVTDECGLFREPVISEQIRDEFEGILDLKEALSWLKSNGYDVEVTA